MIRDWFDASGAVDFGRTIARDINRILPSTKREGRPISPKKEQKKLDGILHRTRTFGQQHRLNVYKKAKLLNTVKWELRDAGHDAKLIDEIIAMLAPLLT
jgi:hypothetical protein